MVKINFLLLQLRGAIVLGPLFFGGGMGHSFIGQLNGSGEREGRGLAGMG